jgi:long-chain acyl-CoA synthetase
MTSILAHFSRLAKTLDDHPAIWRRVDEGPFEPISWRQLYEAVCQAASALRRAGIKRKDRVVHVSENRWEWIVADLAMQAAGAVHVPAHATLAGAQIAWQINDTDAHLLIASSSEQIQKLAGPIPSRLRVVTYDPVDSEAISSTSWPDFVRPGDLAEGEQILAEAIADCRTHHLATILYTSGTTGEPKGVMLSHGNLCSNALAACQVFAQDRSDIRLSFLPLSHIFARTCDLYVTIVGGSQLALSSGRESVIADCQSIHPSHMNAVPYFYEKIQNHLEAAGAIDDPEALRTMFGGSMRFLCSGGAPLPLTTFDFYRANGLPLLQGYGLSESSPIISASSETHYRRGASGQAVPNVDVACAADGEILTRGPHVMLGYYKQPQATDEIVVDGWLHTGDLGQVDDDGYVFVTGRKKELIVTSSGKNVSPLLLEHLMQQPPCIEQAIVIGDNQSYLSAIVVLDPETTRQQLGAQDPSQGNLSQGNLSNGELLELPATHELVLNVIEKQLADLARHEQVRKVILRTEPFSIENGELTPKLSVRRNVITKRHQGEIEMLYARRTSSGNE